MDCPGRGVGPLGLASGGSSPLMLGNSLELFFDNPLAAIFL